MPKELTAGERGQSSSPSPGISSVELRRVVPLREAARLRGISIDTLRRHHRHLFVRVSPGRIGMRLADVLTSI
jgi:hypothetical protein